MTYNNPKTRKLLFLCMCICGIYYFWHNETVYENSNNFTTKVPVTKRQPVHSAVTKRQPVRSAANIHPVTKRQHVRSAVTKRQPVRAAINIQPVIKRQHTPKRQLNLHYFRKLISNEEMSIFKLLVKTFFEVFPKNATCFLMYGSLLGAYRHHDIIPWDIDVDLIIRASDLPSVWNAFKSITYGNFRLIKVYPFIWRLCHQSSELVFGRDDLRWPFLDIFFYEENSTHIWDLNYPKRTYIKRFIYPLRKIPFMGFNVPAPQKPLEILERLYNINKCKMYNYRLIPRHLRLKESLFEGVSCDLLMDRYPFVKRRDNGSGIIETLQVNGTVVPGHIPFFVEHGPDMPDN